MPVAVMNEAHFDKLIAAGNTFRLIGPGGDPVKGVTTWAEAVEAAKLADHTLRYISTASAYMDGWNSE